MTHDTSPDAGRRHWLRRAAAWPIAAAAPGIWLPASAQVPARDAAVLDRLAGEPAATCTATPPDMEGPFGLRQILGRPELMRSAIHENQPGVPLWLRLRVVDLESGCRPLAGAAVYLWHCDRMGAYSGYDVRRNPGQSGTVFMRGVQLADARGEVTFRTIFPGWYRGRVTHLHVMVFDVAARLQPDRPGLLTSQLAFPDEVVQSVYEQPLYPRGPNRPGLVNATDALFRDGVSNQLLRMAGGPEGPLHGAATLGVRSRA